MDKAAENLREVAGAWNEPRMELRMLSQFGRSEDLDIIVNRL